jgi:hypothetical protein
VLAASGAGDGGQTALSFDQYRIATAAEVKLVLPWWLRDTVA